MISNEETIEHKHRKWDLRNFTSPRHQSRQSSTSLSCQSTVGTSSLIARPSSSSPRSRRCSSLDPVLSSPPIESFAADSCQIQVQINPQIYHLSRKNENLVPLILVFLSGMDLFKHLFALYFE